jgi:hypothetical protein
MAVLSQQINTAMKYLLRPAIVLATLVSCKSGEKKYKEMATEMCGCFNKIKDSISPAAMVIFEKAAASPNAKKAYMSGAATLSPADALKLNNALLSFSKPGSAAKECLEDMDKKYKKIGGDKNEVTQKMLDELKDNRDCALMIALMRMEVEK